jgi:hypothetical protein
MIRLKQYDPMRLARIYLPPHKRQNNLLNLLLVLLSPISILMQTFIAFRDNAIRRTYVDGSCIALGWYLNSLFDPVNQLIYLNTRQAGGITYGRAGGTIVSETDHYELLGLEATEPISFLRMPRVGEDFLFGSYSFVVFCPTAVQPYEQQIRQIVNNYRFAGKTFTIIYY